MSSMRLCLGQTAVGEFIFCATVRCRTMPGRSLSDKPSAPVGGVPRGAVVSADFRSGAPVSTIALWRLRQETAMANVTSVLNDLIETSRDGEKGFRTAAEDTKNAELKEIFL